MRKRRFVAVPLLLLLGAFVSTDVHDTHPVLSGEDWWIEPDPPSADKDLEITYVGDEPDVVSASYSIDGGTAVKIDLTKKSRVTIPASALRGARILHLHAKGGGERGFRIVRFPSPR